MFELTIGKSEYWSNRNIAFDVDVMYYKSKNGITDMRVPTRACSGYYVTDKSKEIDCGVSQVLSSLNKDNKLIKPIIVFDKTHITRELTQTEKSSREALEKFLNQDIKHPELKVGKTYEEVVRFKEAVNLIKDKEKVNGMLPVPVESIAFIEMENTEGDFILSQEAELIDTWQAFNGNMFNIYKLW